MDNFDVQLKLIVIGDAAVGKSCLLHRFIENRCINIFAMRIQDREKSTNTIRTGRQN